MLAAQGCDLCGGSGVEGLEHDRDGLWICSSCRSGLVTAPVGEWEHTDPGEEISVLAGKSVGAICYTLNLPDEPPYQRIIKHAVELHNQLMSAWVFVAQWADGTTVWRDEAGRSMAFASGEENVQIRRE